jgi:hypothetical protein
LNGFFHGVNAGSNPAGDANKRKELAKNIAFAAEQLILSRDLPHSIPVDMGTFLPLVLRSFVDERIGDSSSMNRLHDPQKRMPVNVLQWKVDEMGLRIDGDRMCMRHMELTELAQVAIALFEYRNCARFR